MATLAERMAKYSTDFCVNWAAMLICGVQEEKIKHELSRARADVYGGGVSTHPDFPYFADVAKALHEAIEKDKIPCGEYGNGKGRKFLSERYVPPAARTIFRQDLKNYLLQIADPLEVSELPGSLFSEAEREMHMARSPETFNILLDKLNKAEDKLKQNEKQGTTEQNTLLKIIGALLEIIIGQFKGESFKNQTKLIDHIVETSGDLRGISESTLKHVFPLAKEAISGKQE